jgi:thioredoxin 1
MLAPVLKDVAKDLNFEVREVNIEDQFEIAEQYGVMKVPTLVVLKDGQETDRIVGFLNKQALTERLK